MANSPRKKPHDDGNSEKELIKLIREILQNASTVIMGGLTALAGRIGIVETKQQLNHQALMTALETLTDSINKNTTGQAELTTAVNAAIVRIGTPGATDAQLLSLAAAVDGSTASDKALTDALNAALTPVPPTP